MVDLSNLLNPITHSEYLKMLGDYLPTVNKCNDVSSLIQQFSSWDLNYNKNIHIVILRYCTLHKKMKLITDYLNLNVNIFLECLIDWYQGYYNILVSLIDTYIMILHEQVKKYKRKRKDHTIIHKISLTFMCLLWIVMSPIWNSNLWAIKVVRVRSLDRNSPQFRYW